MCLSHCSEGPGDAAAVWAEEYIKERLSSMARLPVRVGVSCGETGGRVNLKCNILTVLEEGLKLGFSI